MGKAEIRRQVDDALRLVNLPAHGDRLPRQLSGGQQQRVALARAMVYRPALLLMDEPLGALDKKLRGQMQLEIMAVHRERRMSVLYVTHDQEEALTMSDRIAVFNAGRVEQVGTPAELYERPATRFVAGFVGEMNFLAGELRDSTAGLAQVDLRGQSCPAANPHGVQPGRSVVVAVRPERMAVSVGTGIPATLEDVIYLGNARRYLLRLLDGSTCTALRQAACRRSRRPRPRRHSRIVVQARARQRVRSLIGVVSSQERQLFRHPDAAVPNMLARGHQHVTTRVQVRNGGRDRCGLASADFGGVADGPAKSWLPAAMQRQAEFRGKSNGKGC